MKTNCVPLPVQTILAGVCGKTLRTLLLAAAVLGLSSMMALPAQAQVIHSIETAGGQRVFPLGVGVTFRIEFHELTGSPWCGFAVDFGDGVIREFRAGAGGVLDFPMILPYAYTAEGDYTVRVSGKIILMGGLVPVQPCRGESPFVRIRIQDEKKRADQDQQLRARFDEIDARLTQQAAVINQYEQRQQQHRARQDEVDARLTQQAAVINHYQQREQQQRARQDEVDARIDRQAMVIEQQQRLIDALQKRGESQANLVGLVVEIQALREQVRQSQADLAQVRQSQTSAAGASEQRLKSVEQRQLAIDVRQRLLDERFQLLSERQRLLEGRIGDVPSTQVAPVR